MLERSLFLKLKKKIRMKDALISHISEKKGWNTRKEGGKQVGGGGGGVLL